MIPLVRVAMPPQDVLIPEIQKVLYSGMIAEGEYVYQFEQEFGDCFNLKNVVATNSGTAALHLALLVGGVNPDDEVITTSMTAEPTNTAILQVGAKPKFVDVDPETGNIDPMSIEKAISKKTRAICVVHYAGYPADIDKIRRIADANELWLIEDCAHALGAEVNSKPIGSIGDAAIFSFQAIKHMTTVDGGALILKDPNQIDKARKLRWFGMRKGVPRTLVDIEEFGFKYNMNNVTAIIGLQQLKYAKSNIELHKRNGNRLNNELKNLRTVKPSSIVTGASPTYWLYTALAESSEKLISFLESRNVMASKLHRPNHLHTVFKQKNVNLPNLNQFYRKLVHLPCGWWVDDESLDRIILTLHDYERGN